MKNTKEFIGLTKEEAEVLGLKEKLRIRVVHKDGVDLLRSCDFRTNRVNLFINNGIVTKANIG